MEHLLSNDEPLYKTLCGPLLSCIEVQAEETPAGSPSFVTLWLSVSPTDPPPA